MDNVQVRITYSPEAAGLAQAMIGLSSAAIVGGAVQGIRYKKVWPYAYVIFTAICYLIYGAITSSVAETFNDAQKRPNFISFISESIFDGFLDYFKPLFSKVIATIFFMAISAPILWILLFDTFRVISSPKQDGTIILGVKLVPSLAGTYFGYLWAFIHIVIAIAVSGSLDSIIPESFLDLTLGSQSRLTTLSNISNCGEFLSYGLWAFVAALLVQLYLSRNDVRHILLTFGPYILFTILVTIGFTVAAVEPSYVARFVLTQLFGVLALYVAILAGHTWVSTVPEEVHDEENTSMQQV